MEGDEEKLIMRPKNLECVVFSEYLPRSRRLLSVLLPVLRKEQPVGPLFSFKTPKGTEITLGAIAGILIIIGILAYQGQLAELPKLLPFFSKW